MKRAPGALARSVTLYLEDWAAVEKFADENSFSVSLAVREIIREWAELKAEKEKKKESE